MDDDGDDDVIDSDMAIGIERERVRKDGDGICAHLKQRGIKKWIPK
jgi:hypothetical protein